MVKEQMKQSVSQSRSPSPRCWTRDECDHPPSDLGGKRKEKEAKGMTQQQEARRPGCVDNECQWNKMKKTLIPSTTYFQDIHNLQCFGWVILGINATGMPFPVKKGIILHTMCNFYVNCSWNEISSRNKSTLFSPTNKEKRCEIMYVWYISAKQ